MSNSQAGQFAGFATPEEVENHQSEVEAARGRKAPVKCVQCLLPSYDTVGTRLGPVCLSCAYK